MRSTIRSLVFTTLGLTLLPISTQLQTTLTYTVLPTRYDEHRFFAEPVTDTGEKLSFFTDTGGGLFIYKDIVKKLKLEKTGKLADSMIGFPKFKPGFSVPAPFGSNGKVFVLDRPKDAPPFGDFDGMLGEQWFADRIWTFDYPGKRLILWHGKIRRTDRHATEIGFKVDARGKRLHSFPRISIEVDGERLEMLFDTGATVTLSNKGSGVINEQGAERRAASFITNSVFEKWRKRHPNWRVIDREEANSDQPMIEARNIRIGGHIVEAAWFTRRADRNFHEYMTGLMDKKVEGAIGGNILRFFRITIDYPRSIAFFDRGDTPGSTKGAL